jgi:hypothetical protein
MISSQHSTLVKLCVAAKQGEKPRSSVHRRTDRHLERDHTSTLKKKHADLFFFMLLSRPDPEHASSLTCEHRGAPGLDPGRRSQSNPWRGEKSCNGTERSARVFLYRTTRSARTKYRHQHLSSIGSPILFSAHATDISAG